MVVGVGDVWKNSRRNFRGVGSHIGIQDRRGVFSVICVTVYAKVLNFT